EMFPGQSGDQSIEHRPGRSVAGVPADPQLPDLGIVDSGQAREQGIDVAVEHIDFLDRSRAILPLSCRREPSDGLDVLSEERTPLKHLFEAVVVGGIMAAGYLYAAIDLFR